MCRSCPVVAEQHWKIPPAQLQQGRVVSAPSSPWILWFEDFTEEHRDRVGGKNASLGSMITAGLPVPPGFAVTTDAYATLRDHPTLVAHVRDTLAGVDFDDARALQQRAASIRSAIEELPIAEEIVADITAAYLALCERCQSDAIGVAVRSSATAEDQPDASFAGQQDTYLWVHGAEQVVDAVRRCWSSIFTDRAIAYRRQMGYDDRQISMSVGVQKMVDPKAAGVAFTLNPTTGDRSQIAIDASWGLGEAVVSGEVTPDNFVVDKVLREVVERTISDKAVEYRRVDGVVRKVEVEDERRDVQCLTDEEICAVALMARRAERHYGRPQDIEWALDKDLPDGENVILLQARPETVWSKKPRESVSDGSYDPMKSIVSTLLSPMHRK